MRILVTGANGYLGQGIVKAIIESGNKVIATDFKLDNVDTRATKIECIHGYYINIELLFNYIKKKNIRVVWTQHDCWAFTGHCAYFDACGCEKWKTGCYDCEQIHTYPISYIDNTKHNWKLKKKYFGGLDAIIVSPCNWLNGIVNESFLNIYESIVIYNGIDLLPLHQLSF